MEYKTLKDINLKNKLVLLRIDINSEVVNGMVKDNLRFKEHARTINFLLSKNARVTIIAHQSRPGYADFTDLSQHTVILNKYISGKNKIKFVNDIIGNKAIEEIELLNNGEAILLDNIRKLKDEFNPSLNNKIVSSFRGLFDYYVNDAFSVCHRNQTSVVSFPKIFPSAIGLVMGEELTNLDKLRSRMNNSLFILGGNKAKDVILLVKNKKILLTGTISLLALMAKGYKLGKEESILKKDLELIPVIKKNIKNFILPVDLAVNANGKRKEISLDELPVGYLIFDIGTKTIDIYKKEIKKANAIFFKGTPGYSQYEQFSKGTRELLKAVADSKAFSIVSGGSTSSAVERYKINKKAFNHISLSGGALVYYLAGMKLPGLEALKIKNKKREK